MKWVEGNTSYLFMLFVAYLIFCYNVTFPQIVKLTVYRMLPKNLQRRTMMQRLHLFPEDVSSNAVKFLFLCDLEVKREC